MRLHTGIIYLNITVFLAACSGKVQNSGETFLCSSQEIRVECSIASLNATTDRFAAYDEIRLTVTGREDLSGEFEVDDYGYINLPLIGGVKAFGLTIKGLEEQIAYHYSIRQNVNNPEVKIEFVVHRPFFVLGEINDPGVFDYRPGMVIADAILLAGGVSNPDYPVNVILKRDQVGEFWISNEFDKVKLTPGDIIVIAHPPFF